MSEYGDTLVLGATSLVGRFLLARSAAEKSSLTALSRLARPAQSGVRWVQGDLAQPKTLTAIGAVGQVFSLQPIWLLPQALPALGELGMRRLVAFSSTSRFTKQGSTSAQERQTAEALAEGEAAVETFCRANGVGFTILRPTLIYAEGEDANVSRLAGLICRFGILPLAGEGRGLRQPVHADDLAALSLEVMAHGAGNRAYEVPGGETLTYRVMAERIFAGLGRRPFIVPLPMAVVRLGYALARPLLPGSTVQMLTRMDEDLVFDSADARRDLNWAPRDFHPEF